MLTMDLKILLFFLPILTLAAALVPPKWKSAVLSVGGFTACWFFGWKTFVYALLSVFLGWFAVRCCPRSLQGKSAQKAKAWICISIVLQILLLMLSGCKLPLLISGIQAVIAVFDRAHGMLRIPSLPQYVGYVCEFPRWFGLYPVDFADYRSMQKARKFSVSKLGEGLWLMVLGAFQNIVLAMPMLYFYSMIANPQAGNSVRLPLLDAWLSAIAVYCVMFFRIHGWLDIGRGMLCVCGYDLPEGYDTPTFSASLPDYCKRVWTPLHIAARDLLGIADDTENVPMDKWALAVLICGVGLGLVFAESLLGALIWGITAAAIMLLARLVSPLMREKLPLAAQIVITNLLAIALGGALFGTNCSGKFGDALALFGVGGFGISSSATYALSWHWFDLLLCLIFLLPLRSLIKKLADKYPVLQKLEPAAIPLAELGMLVLCIIRLVTENVMTW